MEQTLTTPRQSDVLRPLFWLAVAAFCVGFAGFLAIGGAMQVVTAAAPDLAASDVTASLARPGG